MMRELSSFTEVLLKSNFCCHVNPIFSNTSLQREHRKQKCRAKPKIAQVRDVVIIDWHNY